jgi:Yip1 domain
MSTANLSSLSILTDIITAPHQAFAALKERATSWLPLLILIVATASMTAGYFLSVDLPWMLDRTFSQAQGIPQAQREQTVQAALKVSPSVYAALYAVGSAIVIPVIFALTALYTSAVSFATGDGVKFKQWFALAAWCSIPTVFGILAALVRVLGGDVRFMQLEELNPFSFGNLLGVDMANVTTILQRVLLSRDVTTVWWLALSIVGYQAFTKRSLVFSAAVVLGPIALVVAIGMAVALR